MRIIVTLLSLSFAGIGIGFWLAPEELARRFQLQALGVDGLSTLRADLAGLFAGVALIGLAGVWTKRRDLLSAAVLILVAVVTGRLIGVIANGWSGWILASLAVEVVAIAAFAACARGLGAAPAASERRGSRGILKIAIASIVVLALMAVAALQTPAVQQAIFDRAALQLSATTNTAPLEDDALRVAIAGSSAPLPSAARAKASVVVFAGGKFWVIDSGPESVERLVLWGIPLAQIGGVLLTHFHSDHIGDLGELHLQTWAGGRAAPLAVYGGPGVESVVEGFNRAYRLDQGYRTAHHGEKVMPSTSWGMTAVTVDLDGPPTPAKDRIGQVYDDGTLRITAIEVDHAPIAPAYAYRFDYKGRSAVITGDLKYHPPLVRSAANADVLVSEAISRSMTKSLETAARSVGRDRTGAIMHDVQDYHISPEEAARIANDASVQHLAFYHLLPAPDGWLPRQLFARGVNEVRKGGWTIADDGSLYTLPLGTKEVRVGRIKG